MSAVPQGQGRVSAVSIALGSLALVLSTCLDRVESPGGDEPLRPDRRCSLTASVPYWDQASAVRSLSANHDVIDAISVFWFHLDPTGVIRPYTRARPSQALLAWARERGIRVLALVANLPDDEREGPGKSWDAARVAAVLRPPAARARHVQELVALVDQGGFDGLHIDYEALEAGDRDDFTALIAELARELHAGGKLLAVALHPKSSEGNPREDNGSRAQDWLALAAHADQLHLMTYSQHTAQTKPGPVAAPAWIEPILAYAIAAGLPPEKVFVGLPFYAEQWSVTESGAYVGLDRDLTYRDIQLEINAHGGSERWSSRHASPYAIFRDDTKREQVAWFENARSVAAKLALGGRFGLCNVAVWRLGDEDPQIWPAVRAVFGRKRDRVE